MNYQVIKYNPELKSQMLELQKDLWSTHISVNNAYFEWKYEQNPYVRPPLIYVALYQEKVVGMRGIYGAGWQIGSASQVLPALCAGDLVIAPEHRNRGLFTMIMKTALNDMADLGYLYVFNLSASRVTYLASLTTGWRSAGDLQTLRHTTWHRMMKYLLQTQFKKFSIFSTIKMHTPFYFLDRNAELNQNSLHPHIVLEQVPRTEEMAELALRIYRDGRIRHVRDQKYFAWRFKNPLCGYRFLFWKDTRLEGYLILQTQLYKDQPGINIVDWEATDLNVRSDLLQTAISFGKFNALSIWSATLSEDEKSLLQKNGFYPLKRKRGVTQYRRTVLVRSVHENTLKTDWVVSNCRLLDLSNWDLRMIDSDAN